MLFYAHSISLVGKRIGIQYLVLNILRYLFIYKHIHVYTFSCRISGQDVGKVIQLSWMIRKNEGKAEINDILSFMC